MNHIYRLIWNNQLNAWVAAPEIAKTRGKRGGGKSTGLILALGGMMVSGQSFALDPGALPSGGQISAGAGHISQAGNQMTIQQQTPRMVADWQSFNIGKNAQVDFHQPSTSSVALNRIGGQDASQIQGKLNANGQVYLLNPNGVVFGKTAQVNVGGLVASTHQISDADFKAGKLKLTSNGSNGSVENQGTINAKDGVVALIGNKVSNDGTITSPKGDVVLAAGEKVQLDFDGDGLVKLEVDGAAVNTQVKNQGLIQADGAVIMTAKAANALVTSVVNNDGIVEAQSVQHKNGRILLDGGDVTNTGTLNAHANTNKADITIKADNSISHTGTAKITEKNGNTGSITVDSGTNGITKIDGTITANSTTSKGGDITVLGKDIQLNASSQLQATGKTGGGTVLVGGDWQGSGDKHQATSVTMDKDAQIDVSATGKGDGGKAVLWSDVHKADGITIAKGKISAKAGKNGGNGGQIETSGHQVDIDGVQVNAGTTRGKGGSWLVDPYNYTIGTTQATTISNTLNTGTSVTVDTAQNVSNQGSSGNSGDAGDITLSSSITKTGGADATLTLMAQRHVLLQSSASISSTSNKLNVQLWADSNNDGDGIINFASPSISTNGGWIKFGNNVTASLNGVTSLVGGDVFFNSASAQTISTSGGNINVYGEAIVSNSSGSGVTFNSGGGSITFSGLLNSGNQYTYVDGPDGQGSSWDWARTNAKNGTAGGAALGDSYMVTITSRLENSMAGIAAGYRGSWIGAYRPNYASYAWIWADGPEAGQQFFTQNNPNAGTTASGYYSNFGSGEPNGCTSGSGCETVGQFFGTAGQWNDLYAGTSFSGSQGSQYDVLGYVRETNLQPSAVTISAGSGAVTFNGGVGGSKALASLDVSAGSIAVNGNALVTTGTQTYNQPLTVISAADLKLGASTLRTTDLGESLMFKAAGNITSAAGTTFQTNKADLTFWSDSDANGGGNIQLGDSNVLNSANGVTTSGLSGGGKIVLAGGADSNADGIPDGYAASAFGNGVKLGTTSASNTQMYSGGGDIIVRGSSNYSAGNAVDQVGLYQLGQWTANSGKGSITLAGVSQNNYGINFVQPVSNVTTGTKHLVLISDKVSGNAISITGNSNASHGVVFNYNNPKEVLATGGGDIVINGTAGAGAYGIFLQNQDILASTGSITLNGGARGIYAASAGAAFGARTGDSITSSSANISLVGDVVSFAGASSATTTGTFTLAPSGNNFSGTMSTANLSLASTVSALTLGKNIGNTIHTDAITVGSNLSVAGPISVYAGKITLNNTVTSTDTGDINLIASANTNDSYIGNVGINKTGGGDSTLTIRSGGRLNQSGGAITNTSNTGKLNVVLWSDYNNANAGGVSGIPAITTKGGNLWVGGSNSAQGSTTWNGLTVGDGPSVSNSSANYNAIDWAGAINTANGASGGEVMIWAGTPVSGAYSISATTPSINAGSGAVTIRGDSFSWNVPMVITTTGVFSLLPNSTSFTSAPNTNWFNFSGATLSGLTMGSLGNTQNVAVDSAQSIAGPINIYAGNIYLNSNLTTTSGASGLVSLLSSDSIIGSSGANITTAGANILLSANSDNTNGGAILLDHVTLASSGGNITLGGGSDGNGYAEGSATANSYSTPVKYRGIWTNGNTINAGGGNIVLRGKGWQGGSVLGFTMGIDIVGYESGSSFITTGNGSITLDAIGGNNYESGAHGAGINFFCSVTCTSNSFSTQNGAINISGLAGSAASTARVHAGLNFDGGTTSFFSSTGNVTLTGNGVSSDTGINNNGSTINLGGSGSGTNTTGNVMLRTNSMSTVSGTINVLNTGTLTVEPIASSFTSALSWPLSGTTLGNGLAGLTLGKDGNTANITIGSAQSIAGPINIYGGAIAINAALTATGSNTITLKGSGNITDGASGYLVANNLLLLGSGSTTLDNALNNIGTLAAGSSFVRIGSLDYTDSNALSIGSVGSYNGIFSSGTISVATTSNDLTLAKSIDTTNNSTSAIKLNAGKSTAAGTGTGGNLLVSNSPSLTTGTGGRATLYSGSLTDTTLAGLIGSATGHFRYNSDESATNYTTLLGSGNYAIYREQPLLNVTANNETITYGNQPLLTAAAAGGGLVNGDLLSAAVVPAPTVEVYDHANASPVSLNSTGYYNADAATYTLRVTNPASSALGYGYSSTNGALTVNSKALAITANNDSKFVTQADVTGYQGVSLVGLAAGETAADLAGSLSIARSGKTGDGSADAAGNSYTLTPSGYTSSNYAVTWHDGNYIIVPADTLRIVVSNLANNQYGDARNYTLSSVSYMDSFNGNAIATLTPLSHTGNSYSYDDGSGTPIDFTVAETSPSLNGTNLNVGLYSLTAAGVNTHSSPNLANGLELVGNVLVNPKALTLTASKTYDGNADFTGSHLILGGMVGSETLTYTNAIANDANAATANKYIRAITLADGSNGGLASNYQLPSLAGYSAGVNSVNIDRKALTISANKTYDSTTDVTDFVSLNGLVTGESLAVSNAIANNSHVATTGKFINSLTLADASGMVSNYALPSNLTPATGVVSTFSNNTGNSVTITPQTLVASLTNTNVTKVYDGTINAPGNGNGSFTPTFNVSGFVGSDTAATITNTAAAYDFMYVANASKVTISGLAVSGITGGAGQASDYILDSASKDVAATITARPVQVSSSATGLSKVYDGTNAMTGVTVSLAGISGNANSGEITGDNLIVSGTGGSFSTADAGANKVYTLVGLRLSGALVSNYAIFGATGSTLQGNDGVIYQRPLAVTFTGDDKVYDGQTTATVTTSYANSNYAPVGSDDVSVVRTAAFADKNVDTGKAVSISAVSLTGAAANNYSLTYSASNPLNSPTVGSNAGYNTSTIATITRLNSVTWIGGSTGNWFDPANWAGGAVPDLANVANVTIPANVTVDFGSTVVPPAQSGTVNIDSLGATGGGLNMSAGQLAVGTGGINLGAVNQTGGTLSSTGDIILDNFSQSAGTLSAGNNFTVNQDFAQTGTGTIDAIGNTSITDNTGGVVLGNLTSHGTLGVVSTNGNISQTTGTTLTALDTSSLNAGTDDVILTNAGNNFVGAVAVTADNASLRDDTGGIILGNVNTTGALAINSTNGNISQANGTSVQSSGSTSLDAGTFDVILANTGNDFVGSVTVIADDATLRDDTGGIELGNITTTGTLGVTSTGGDISQANGSTINANGVTTLNAGNNDVTLSGANNNFGSTVNATGNDINLVDGTGGLILGDVTSTGTLGVTSTGGDISQANGSTINANGVTTLNAGNNDITLSGANNNFGSTVNATGNDINLVDGTGGLILGDVTSTGTLGVTSTGGDISQANGSAINANGVTTLNAGNNDITLSGANNNFGSTVNATGNDINLVDGTGGLILGNVTSSGTLGVTSTGGDISQANGSAINANGVTTLNAGNNDITLSGANNNFGSTVNATGNDINLVDGTGGLILGDVTSTGTLGVTSTGGDISQANGSTINANGVTTLNAGNNDITLSGANNNFGSTVNATGNDINLVDGTGGLILGDVTSTGTLGVTSTGGDISQANGSTINANGVTTLNAGNNDITLSGANNNFGSTVNATGNDINLVDGTGGLILGDVTSSGTLGVTSTGGDISQANGSTINANGVTTLNAGNNDITLSGANNNFGSTVNATGNDINLVDGTGGLILGNVTSTGTLGVTSTGGDISQANGSTINANGVTTLNAGNNDITLSGTNNNFGSTVNATGNDINLVDGSGGLILGNVTSSGLLNVTSTGGDISQANGSTVNANGVTTLNAGNNDITLSGANNNFGSTVNATGNDINLVDGTGGLILGDVTSSGTLGVTSTGGDISQANGSTINANGVTTLNAGNNDITLSGANNNFGSTVNATGNDINLVDGTGGLILGNVTSTGTLGVTSTGGDISQANGSTINANGVTTLNAGNNDITLSGTNNNFGSTVNATGNDINLVDGTGGLILGDVTSTGTLGVTSTGGDISQANGSTINANGVTTLNAGNNDITLSGANNNFGSTVNATGNDINLVDGTGGLILGDVTSTGTLGVTSTGGDISQANGSTINANGVTTLNAGNNDITLSGTNNNFGSTVNATGNDINLVDGTGGLILGDVTSTGTLGVTSTGGDISQANGSTINANGVTTLNAGNNDITLSGANNNFGSTVNATGNDINLVDGTGGLILGDVTSTGTLGVTSTGGDISQTGDSIINVGGTTTLLASANGQPADIILAGNSNNFAGTVNADGSNITLTDAVGGLELGNINSTSGLTATSNGGNISQKAGTKIVDKGTTNLSASKNGLAADILLANDGNNFSTVNATGKTVKLADATGFTQGTITAEDYQAPFGSDNVTGNLVGTVLSSVVVPQTASADATQTNASPTPTTGNTGISTLGAGSSTVEGRQNQELVTVAPPTAENQGMSLMLSQGSVAVEVSQTAQGMSLTLPKVDGVTAETHASARQQTTLQVFVDNANSVTYLGNFSIVDDGIQMTIADAGKASEQHLPAIAKNKLSSQSSLTLTDGSQISLSVSVDTNNVLTIQVPATKDAQPSDQQREVLLGLLIAKQNLYLATTDLAGIVLSFK